MQSSQNITDNYGPMPPIESYAFKTASGTAIMSVEMIGADGRTVYTGTVSVTTTEKVLAELLGTNWRDTMIGGYVTNVLTAAVYYNNSGSFVPPVAVGGTGVGTVNVAIDTTNGRSIPIGSYAASPYKMGRVV